MTDTTLYGIKTCDRCRRAHAWLRDNGVAVTFHDVRRDGAPCALPAWLEHYGVNALVNRRSTTWRQLTPADRARVDSEPGELLAEHPTLLRRPLLSHGNELVIGFDPAVDHRVLELPS
ncbi:MAG: Spx/MgsR family RNA polymerase-binding regulatory protein [Ectothiorhodospiraceae bacterium]